MKPLLYSLFFSPSLGDVETVVRSLASGSAGLLAHDGREEL